MENNNDSYEELLRQLSGDSGNGVSFSKNDSEVKNNGEIYFSANSTNQTRRPASTQNSRSQDGISFTGNGGSGNRISQPRTTPQRAGATRDVRVPSSGTATPRRTGTTGQQTTNGRNAGTAGRQQNTGNRTAATAGGANQQPVKKRSTTKPNNPNGTNPPQNGKKKKKKSKSKGKKLGVFTSKLLICIVAIVLLAVLIKIPIMSCINDVLALDGTNVEHRVSITQSLECDEVIDLLGEKKLISNPWFCKIVAKFMDFDEYKDSEGNKTKIMYPPGEYNLSTSMGVEGMLSLIASAGNEDSTVSVTFPEGFTVDQIAEKLELNGVCSKKGFYGALETDKIYEKYEFLQDIDRSERYRAIEGYLYPDTYEFYVGEDPYSAICRFLDNFESKWSDEYDERCQKLGYTMDQILTVASILEKEAKDSEQMPLIASILYNRLAAPGLYPFINCDSTAKYIENAKEIINSDNDYNAYMLNYDTYQRTGLPAGAICNPGADAIYAALHPDSTSYYYFLHDNDGKIYVARTADEHSANSAYIN